MSDHVARVSHTDRYRDLFDQVESDAASDGTGTLAGEYVPMTLSGGLDPTTPPGTDAGSVLAHEEMRVEHRHDGRIEVVHGTPGYDRTTATDAAKRSAISSATGCTAGVTRSRAPFRTRASGGPGSRLGFPGNL